MKRIILAITATLIISACGQKKVSAPIDKEEEVSAEISMDEAVVNSDMKIDQVKFPPSPVEKDVIKKIIKEGEISFETANINDTRKAIYNQLKKLNGYTSSESELSNEEENRKEYTIDARIPAKNFDLFLSNVSANAVKIESKRISVNDVTARFIDVTTRLANNKKLEDRYLELLKKGSKIADVLEIENKLNEIRTEIESTQGQLNYLNKQIDYSSLNITFFTKQTVKESGLTFSYKITNALVSGWDTLGNWFFGFIGLWPLWLLVILSAIITKRWRANIRSNKSKV